MPVRRVPRGPTRRRPVDLVGDTVRSGPRSPSARGLRHADEEAGPLPCYDCRMGKARQRRSEAGPVGSGGLEEETVWV